MPPIELNFPNPIETRSELFDRDDELQLVQATFRSPARRPVVIMGERVMGKTSLLNVTMELVASERLIMLQLPHADTRNSLAEEMLEGIAGEVGTSFRRHGVREANGELRLSTTAEIVRVAGELSAGEGDSTFLLCLEELDSMLVKCPDDAAANQILDFILHLVNNTSLPIKFLFTMTRTAPQILRSHASPFMSAARIIHIAPWTFDDSCAFVTWLLQGAVTLQPEAHEQLYAACGGHPYLTKAVLQAVQRSHGRSAAGRSITSQQLRAAVMEAMASPEVDFTLENIVNAHFSPEELQVLVELAFRAGSLAGADLRALGELHLEAAHELRRRGYLRLHQSDTYTQAFGLLADWLKGKPLTAYRPSAPAAIGSTPRSSGDVPALVVDDIRNRVFVGPREVSLSPQEYLFLRYLAKHAGSVVDRHTVATEVWPRDVLTEGIREARLDTLISRLRRELGDDATTYLETRRGRGFYLNPDAVHRIHRDDQ